MIDSLSPLMKLQQGLNISTFPIWDQKRGRTRTAGRYRSSCIRNPHRGAAEGAAALALISPMAAGEGGRRSRTDRPNVDSKLEEIPSRWRNLNFALTLRVKNCPRATRDRERASPQICLSAGKSAEIRMPQYHLSFKIGGLDSSLTCTNPLGRAMWAVV